MIIKLQTTHFSWVCVMVGWGDWVPHGPLEAFFEIRGKYGGSLPLNGVLSSVGWHGSVLKLGGETLLTARESAAVKYLVLGCFMDPGRN